MPIDSLGMEGSKEKVVLHSSSQVEDYQRTRGIDVFPLAPENIDL